MRENLENVRLRVGRKVRRLRLLRGWSQEELAEKAGNTGKHISDMERGKSNVGINVLISVAGELAVDPAELFRTTSKGAGDMYVLTRQDFERIEEALRIVVRLKRARARPPRPIQLTANANPRLHPHSHRHYKN